VERKAAALTWNAFEGIASHLVADPKAPAEEDIEREIALARIEAHYFMNDSFLETDDQLLRDAGRLQALRGVIVQGRYDLVCPMQSAWDLAAAWPGARLVVVPAAGHAADEPGIAGALVEATEEFKVSATP
jgi:proline iminopeptidase